MVQRRQRERSLFEVLLPDGHKLWPDWLRKIDTLLEAEAVLDVVAHALEARWPQSRRRGRLGTPAEVVMRMLILKHLFDWSYDDLEREVRANLVQTCSTLATVAWGAPQRSPVGRAAGRPRDRQSSAVAGWDAPRRQSGAAPGLLGRVRLSAQSSADTDGGLSDVAGARDRPRADPVSTNSRRPGLAGRRLIATYGGQLKQPDKQETGSL